MLLAGALLALLLASCGGGGGSTATSAPTTTGGSTATGAADGGATGSGGQTGSKHANGSKSDESQPAEGGAGKGSAANAAPLRVSGGGSIQFRSKGGDNSVQEFGEEGGESELQEAAEAVHDFYVARIAEDWTRACSYLAAKEAEQLEQLATQSPQFKGKGCAPILNAFTRSLSPALQREITTVDAGSLRREGEQAFLIYRGAGGTVYAMPMTQEDGAWKVTALSASALQ
jgi:hypothetical protein